MYIYTIWIRRYRRCDSRQYRRLCFLLEAGVCSLVLPCLLAKTLEHSSLYGHGLPDGETRRREEGRRVVSSELVLDRGLRSLLFGSLLLRLE
jgi:hypothetical protein